MVTLGGLFSSFLFGGCVALLVDLPIVIGIAGTWNRRPRSNLFMIFGCVMILIYIAVSTYFKMRAGYGMIPLHIVWACVCLVEATIAFQRFKQAADTHEVTPWPQ
jgi:hypothetical protein